MNLTVTMPNNWKPYKRKSFFNWWIEKVKGDYISQVGWACQCFKDCECNGDWQKSNPHLAIEKQFYRVDANGQNPKNNKFEAFDEAKNVLINL